MNIKKCTLLLFFIGSILLTGGCSKQETVTEPETVIDFLVPPEETQTEINTTPPSEATTEIIPEEQSSTEALSLNAVSETPKTESSVPETQKTENTAPHTQKTEKTASDDTITVSNEFYVTDTWISSISFQMPKGWSYRIDEEPADWGFWIDIPDQEDFTLHIHALPGTLNVESFYTDAPADFTTASGMKGQFYQRQTTGDDGVPYVDGDIVFDHSSGISFLINKDTYNQYFDVLQELFLSVTIKDTYIE